MKKGSRGEREERGKCLVLALFQKKSPELDPARHSDFPLVCSSSSLLYVSTTAHILSPVPYLQPLRVSMVLYRQLALACICLGRTDSS